MSRERFKIKNLMAMFIESFEQLCFTATCRSGKNNQLNLRKNAIELDRKSVV